MTSLVPERKRVAGLDALRCVSALWVFLFHWGALVDRANISGPYGMVFCGPAAVIVFFLISGFCIHYPYRKGDKEVRLFPFLVRRYLRVGAPLFVAMLMTRGPHIQLNTLIDVVGWSIIIELIFYTIYPFIRIPLRSRDWLEFFICVFIFAFLVVLVNGNPRDYGSWGHTYNWLLALPCWLLGARLAALHRFEDQRTSRGWGIWAFRFAVLTTAATSTALYGYNLIGYPWSLNFLAILLFFWIREELKQPQEGRLRSVLEWGGKWSYSLYLMHPLCLRVLRDFNVEHIGSVPSTIMKGLLILLMCYVFHLIVERPSHIIAQWLSMRLERLYPESKQSA